MFISLAVVLVQSFPQEETKRSNEGSHPAVPTHITDQKTSTEPKQQNVPSRVARAANPQNHAVNYIRPDDRFPTVA